MTAVPMIAIVDDDQSIRDGIVDLVRSMGFDAEAFKRAEDFLHSSRLEATSCLITDVRMPGMGGVDLQSYLIARGIKVPIIFITAFPEESSQTRAMKAGAAGFLTKPFDGQTLINCLYQALKRPG